MDTVNFLKVPKILSPWESKLDLLFTKLLEILTHLYMFW